ncbi:hypothetical protein OPQ81_009158 [Rhizoctonia solani]|nr:hypothetical protein OPQ81_009158 [Rhizoctonia solani]
MSCKIRRKKCDETKPQCLRCQASGKACAYEYVEYPESEAYRVKRTKPAPRHTSKGLSRPPRNVSASPSDANLASSFTPPIIGSSTALPLSIIPELPSNGVYPSTSLVVSRSITGPPSEPFMPTTTLQLLSDINPGPVSSSGSSPDLALVPVVTAHATSGSTSQASSLLCVALTIDKNVKENTLPFVLHCYSLWVLVRVFEPLKIAHVMRDQVITQFSSEKSRIRTILIANVMDMFARNMTIDGPRKTILNRLALEVQKSSAAFLNIPPSTPLLDRQNALRTLDSMLEIFSLQIPTQSTHTCIQSLDYAAPVFRRACPDPPTQPVNLANILLGSDLNLQHFATIDIIRSVTTGLPTYVQYEVPSSLELCEYMFRLKGSLGLRWLHGIPDQFILLFAWIISLSGIPEAGRSTELITWIETNLPLIKVATHESGDPALRICRMVVQECWRCAVRIYLYMVLCKANSYDSRVVRAQKGFMRLVRSVKPGRNPDVYLLTPMVIAGVATIEERDRGHAPPQDLER